MNRSNPVKSAVSMAVLLSFLSTPLLAQIYETTDAEGNPSFSDTPSNGALEVETGQTNIVDAVEVPPAPAAQQDDPQTINTSPGEEQQQEEIDPINPYIVNDDDDNDEDDRRREERPLDPREQPEPKRIDRPSVEPAIRETNAAHSR